MISALLESKLQRVNGDYLNKLFLNAMKTILQVFNVKTLPTPNSLSTLILPPWASIKSLLMASQIHPSGLKA